MLLPSKLKRVNQNFSHILVRVPHKLHIANYFKKRRFQASIVLIQCLLYQNLIILFIAKIKGIAYISMMTLMKNYYVHHIKIRPRILEIFVWKGNNLFKICIA